MGIASAFAYSMLSKKKLPSKYYDNLDYDDLKKGQYGQLKSGYISSSTPLHSGYGDALYSKSAAGNKWGKTGKDSYGYKKGTGTSGLYIYNDPKVAQQKQQQAYQQQLQATASAAATANTKQLQILQSEKSAISKMMADYSAQVKAQAEAQAKAQKEAAAAAAASSANQSMMGKSANLQIQTASDTPKTAGTQSFKKLKNQFKINPSYNALGTLKSGTLNI